MTCIGCKENVFTDFPVCDNCQHNGVVPVQKDMYDYQQKIIRKTPGKYTVYNGYLTWTADDNKMSFMILCHWRNDMYFYQAQ